MFPKMTVIFVNSAKAKKINQKKNDINFCLWHTSEIKKVNKNWSTNFYTHFLLCSWNFCRYELKRYDRSAASNSAFRFVATGQAESATKRRFRKRYPLRRYGSSKKRYEAPAFRFGHLSKKRKTRSAATVFKAQRHQKRRYGFQSACPSLRKSKIRTRLATSQISV